MRVAVIFDSFGPYHIARLSAAAKQMDVVAIECAGQSHDYQWTRPGTNGLDHVTLFPGMTSRDQSASEFRARLEQTLVRVGATVVALPGWSSRATYAALPWCARTGVPAIAMSETTQWDEIRRTWKEAVKRRIVSSFSAALVGGSPHRDYAVQLGMPASSVFLGYNAVDNAYFAAASDKVRVRSAKKTGSKGPLSSCPRQFFLASARFIGKKNLPRLIEAYGCYRAVHLAQSEARQPPWSLVLLGDGPVREALVALCERFGLREHVLMPGFVQYADLPEYYARAGAFVLASTSEPWGLVVNEAMASGLPVLVSTQCGCAADLVLEGVNGFTFDPGDVGTLSHLMLRVATSPDRAAMAAASRKVVSMWGPERFAAGLEGAARCARETGRQRHAITDRLLLCGLRH